MNAMQVFNYNDNTIRTLFKDGEPWFVGKDVARILGYTDTFGALKKHVDGEDKQNCQNDSFKSNRGLTVINESGLYSLILSSKLPTAKQFKRWVTSEVLPQIRKTGKYYMESPGETYQFKREVFFNYKHNWKIEAVRHRAIAMLKVRDVSRIIGLDILSRDLIECFKLTGAKKLDYYGNEQNPDSAGGTWYITWADLQNLITRSPKTDMIYDFEDWVYGDLANGISEKFGVNSFTESGNPVIIRKDLNACGGSLQSDILHLSDSIHRLADAIIGKPVPEKTGTLRFEKMDVSDFDREYKRIYGNGMSQNMKAVMDLVITSSRQAYLRGCNNKF